MWTCDFPRCILESKARGKKSYSFSRNSSGHTVFAFYRTPWCFVLVKIVRRCSKYIAHGQKRTLRSLAALAFGSFPGQPWYISRNPGPEPGPKFESIAMQSETWGEQWITHLTTRNGIYWKDRWGFGWAPQKGWNLLDIKDCTERLDILCRNFKPRNMPRRAAQLLEKDPKQTSKLPQICLNLRMYVLKKIDRFGSVSSLPELCLSQEQLHARLHEEKQLREQVEKSDFWYAWLSHVITHFTLVPMVPMVISDSHS